MEEIWDKGSRIDRGGGRGGRERNKGFWPEYLPMYRNQPIDSSATL